MALAQHRVQMLGETPYAHEREGIDFVVSELPNAAPYLAWGLVDLLDPSTGRLYEIDLLVLGYSALYLVELKSGPGTYKGDSSDWYRLVSGERAHYMECPYRLTNHKAKVLASMLQRKLGTRAPRVEALVFLSHPEAKLDLRADGLTAVVTRETVRRALTHHEYPNSDRNWRNEPVSAPVQRELAKALEDCGIKKRKSLAHVGAYELGEVLGDGPGYEDRLAVHRSTKTIKQRARIYLVPQQTSVERRQQLRRAADREAHILYELREHAGVLRFLDYVEDAPLGPTVLFDAFDGAVPLDAFLRAEPKLSFFDRIELIAQVGRALSFCHRRAVLHGGLNPSAVLVRRTARTGRTGEEKLEARVFNFQLGSADDVALGTVHLSALTAQPWLVYQAPELRQDAGARSAASDIFSLGALAYFVLTGQPPAPDPFALDERLERSGALDPRAADDSIPVNIAEAVRTATDRNWTNRCDAHEWVELLLEYATDTEAKAVKTFASPLEAQRDDRIAEDLLVLGVLGQGATARVLHVEQADGSEVALKVSLSADHDERIRAESQALAKFRHPRIVERLGDRTVAGRSAIVLSLAGTRTLQKELAEKGPVVLDYALRWGEDLLSAVEYLESEDITHRDIKPANLGVGATGRRAVRLTLFDFSLVLSSPSELNVGTAAYRDPFLRPPARPAWDAAADRYSAAVTLHEMLTGVRPSWSGTPGVEPGAKLVLAAERFDASARDRLVRFFTQAFAPDLSERFVSAEEMRRAWAICFGAPQHAQGASAPASTPAIEVDEAPPAPAPVTDAQIAAILPETPLEALPLSIRAKNALDRAGVIRARDLARLPDNRLSAIRGVGQLTAREIHEFRARWEKLAAIAAPPEVPFFPNYDGEDLHVASFGLAPDVTRVVVDAGLRTASAVAAASAEHLRMLAGRAGVGLEALHAAMLAEHRRAEERARPASLEGWLDALLPAKRKALRLVRILFGLAAPSADRGPLPASASATEVHEAEGSTTQAVYLALSKARKDWAAHPAIEELVGLVRAVIEQGGGAMPLEDVAAAILLALPHDRVRESAPVEAAALVRLVAELERERDPARVVVSRLGGRGMWAGLATSLVVAARALGEAADVLALRTPLASAQETQEELTRVAGDTPLAKLPADRLAALAARASGRAACSTRLEMYPRGMAAERALELTAAVLTAPTRAALDPAELQRRVADRYPEAEPLPPRPKLDELVASHRLVWSEAASGYVRPGESAPTNHLTSYASVPVHRTALPSEPRAMSAEAIEARDFEDRLLTAIEQRELRVVFVRSDQASRASLRLAARLKVPVRRLDRLLIEAIEARAKKLNVKPDAMHKADREGSAGKAWPLMKELVAGAAVDLAEALLPAKEPLVLSHLGLLTRYQLQAFVDGLAAAATKKDCEAIVLLVAAPDAAGLAPIEGLTVPGLLPSQRLRMPSAWVGNEGNAAAS